MSESTKTSNWTHHSSGHLCGRQGGVKHEPGKQPSLQGHPKAIELTRSERHWIQTRIEKLGKAADPMEKRLLEKVQL
jgi:hypothetical protein